MNCKKEGCGGELVYKVKTVDILTYAIEGDIVDLDKDIDFYSSAGKSFINCNTCGKDYKFDEDELEDSRIRISSID